MYPLRKMRKMECLRIIKKYGNRTLLKKLCRFTQITGKAYGFRP